MSGKIFNRDVILSESASLKKSVGGVVVDIVDSTGNIDRPITTTNATFSGNTTLGDASADTNTINGTSQINAPVTVGVDDTGYDFKLFGATAGAHLLWDESADTLKLVGGAGLDLSATSSATVTAGGKIVSSVANGIYPVILSAAADAISDTAACSVANYYTSLTTTGAATPTLANSTVVGQLKRIQMIVDAGDATLTPTTLNGGTTITYADVGDTADLMWDGAGWQVLALYNIVDGATAPVLA